MKLLLFIQLILSAFFISSCETDEDNNLLKAQHCFNKLRDGASDAEVNTCMGFIAGQNSEEANTLNCGMAMFKGGINTGAIVTAFDAMDGAAEADKESVLLDNLVMDSQLEADDAYSYCRESGSVGLLYIASLARMATTMELLIGGDQTPDQMINQCSADAGTCQATIGAMVSDIATTYCIGGSASNDVCQAALAAVNAGGSAATIGAAFLAQIDPVP